MKVNQVWEDRAGEGIMLVGFHEDPTVLIQQLIREDGYTSVTYVGDITVAFKNGIKSSFFSTPLKTGRILPLLQLTNA